jgi:hypothetical protein
MPVTCRVKKQIDINHRLMKCTFCGAEHIVEVKVNSNGGWKSPRGGRDCRNPQCQSAQIQAAAKAAAKVAAALPANVAAKAAAAAARAKAEAEWLQDEAIANTPEYYDRPAVF